MHTNALLAATTALAALSAARPLPLNINLGAYSPALVVGDGEIGFEGGAATAESLMQSLQGATVAAASAANGAAAAPAAAPAAAAAPAPVAPAATTPEAEASPLNGIGRAALMLPRDAEDEPHEHEARDEAPRVQKRQSGFDRALTFAEAALQKGPRVQLGTGAGGSGVGIIVDNTPTAAAAARPGTAAAE